VSTAPDEPGTAPAASEPRERFRLPAAVYGLLRDQGRLLLLRRAGSGFRDGQLCLPAGHLDGGEDAVSGLRRELREEIGVETSAADCRLVLVLHSAPEHAADREYLNLFFAVDHWTGQPTIGEPDKCSELLWAQESALPDDVVDFIREGLAAVARGEGFLARGW